MTRSRGNGFSDAQGDWLEHRRTCIALGHERWTIEALERDKVEGQRLGFACLVEPRWRIGDECLLQLRRELVPGAGPKCDVFDESSSTAGHVTGVEELYDAVDAFAHGLKNRRHGRGLSEEADERGIVDDQRSDEF